jgi:hypothetical protein
MADNHVKDLFNRIGKESKPPETEFLQDLSYTIQKIEAENRYKPSRYLSPSSMKCIRGMFFKRMGTPIDETAVSPTLTGITQIGSFRHEVLQEYVTKMPNCVFVDIREYVKQYELPLKIVRQDGAETLLLNEGKGIQFKCDGVIRYKNEIYILEIKTESSNKFWQRKGVDSAHYTQAAVYSMLLQIDKVLFVYESRDTTDRKAYIHTPPAHMKTGVVSMIESLEKYEKAYMIPEKPSDLEISKKDCEYCNYRNLCRQVGANSQPATYFK